MAKVVKVQFPAIRVNSRMEEQEVVYAGQHYNYLTDIDFKEGDFAVVDAPKTGLTVVKVVGFGTEEYSKATKWIVDRVDVAPYEERKAKEARKAELLKLMEAEAAKASKLLMYETLAGSSPEFKALLDEYKSL